LLFEHLNNDVLGLNFSKSCLVFKKMEATINSILH